MNVKGKILIADNDFLFGRTVKRQLEEHGYEVSIANDGTLAWKMYRAQSFDLCLFDTVLDKKTGLELTRQIRKQNAFIPILFLSAKRAHEDVAAGFKAGADGYMIKPLSIRELIMRIAVFIRRTRPLDADKTDLSRIGSLTFDHAELKLIDAEGKAKPPYLTKKEAELLRFFCHNANKIIKRQEILLHVWGKDDRFIGRSMDVFISKLRKRFIGEPGVELITYHGLGFKLILP